jgi:hypothetical protein
LLHAKINEIINFKNIRESDDPELVFINNESYNFVDFYLKNNLTPKIKWLFITIHNKQQTEILYKEIRNYAEDSMLIGDLIILKNIKENFDCFFRQNFILPVKKTQKLDIENFFEFKIEKNNLDVKNILEKNDIKLSKLLTNNSQYVYFGEPILEEDFDKCKMLLNMRLNILFCEQNSKVIGYFCKHEYIKDLLIYLYSNSKIMEDILKFQIFKLNVPVNRI